MRTFRYSALLASGIVALGMMAMAPAAGAQSAKPATTFDCTHGLLHLYTGPNYTGQGCLAPVIDDNTVCFYVISGPGFLSFDNKSPYNVYAYANDQCAGTAEQVMYKGTSNNAKDIIFSYKKT